MARSVYDALRDEIVTGKLAPGTPLVATALAKRFRVSRTPIREALLKLRQDGLVEPTGGGLEVRRQSPEEILEIYELRVLLEEFAARSAASRRSELDLNRLVHLHRDMCQLPFEDADARIRANRAFHEQIWVASHNRTLRDLLERISTLLHRYPEPTLNYPGRWETVLSEHEALIEAISEGRAEEAAKIAAQHMSAARDLRLKMYSETPA
ncbi:MAG TPA: GntR family transcriptional regulator [Acidimicrobiales bacterium]|nr:GntR family transcriptional regulator [Acidimicrobiales bacterium]